MFNWRTACLALSLSFLLLASGCFAPEEDTTPLNSQVITPAEQLASCALECEQNVPHSVENIDSGTCKCFCEEGYHVSDGVCVKDASQDDPAARCTSACGQKYPHSVGSLNNEICSCPCEEGYLRQIPNGSCITQEEYDSLQPDISPASCNLACGQMYPHSVGSLNNGTCSCPCEKGYVSYNKTCVTPQDFTKLGPVLCSKEYPVLKIYDWSFKGKNNYIYLCYANDLKGDVLEDRSKRRDYWNFVGDPYSNSSVSLVTKLLTNISEREGYGKYEQVELAIEFVQSLPYTYDTVTTPYNDYPRFPSETIYADGGDCEDTSILLAAILNNMGYDVVLFGLPGHVAVGVSCDPSIFNYTVASYAYNGRNYCYIETAGDQTWRIGDLPAAYVGVNPNIILLRNPQPDLYLGQGQTSTFHVDYSYDAYDTYVDVTQIRIDNFGTVPAKNVKLYVALETTQEGKVWDQYTLTVGDLAVRGYSQNGRVTNLHAPGGESFRVKVVAYADNSNSVESKSGWVTWH